MRRFNLLPEVEKKTTADGRPIKLSRDGNDRAIAGASSGAICAITAAWERPDSFRRVFSAIGTYEVNHDWGTGGHSGEHATRVFPDAMRWLWKDWPAPVKAGHGSPQLQEILIPGEGWNLVGEGYRFTEGPAPNAQGEVFFNDIPNGKAYKIGLDGKVSLHIAETKHANGQAFGPDGRLYAAATGSGQILAYDSSGGNPDVVAEGIRVDRDGRLYVTTLMGIQVCDQAGRVNCIIPTPKGKVANLCFGGADFQTLFATCGDRVYQRKVKVKGVNAYEAPVKPKAPRL